MSSTSLLSWKMCVRAFSLTRNKLRMHLCECLWSFVHACVYLCVRMHLRINRWGTDRQRYSYRWSYGPKNDFTDRQTFIKDNTAGIWKATCLPSYTIFPHRIQHNQHKKCMEICKEYLLKKLSLMRRRPSFPGKPSFGCLTLMQYLK